MIVLSGGKYKKSDIKMIKKRCGSTYYCLFVIFAFAILLPQACVNKNQEPQSENRSYRRVIDSAGLLLQSSERAADALSMYESAIAIPNAKPTKTDYYNAACAACLANNHDTAFYYLNKAIAKGWRNIEELQSDKDLNELANDKRWASIISNLEKELEEDSPGIWWGIYTGILFMLLFYNLILFFFLRESQFFYYVLFLFMYISLEMTRTQVVSIYLPQFLLWLKTVHPENGRVFSTCLVGITYLAFAGSLLKLRTNSVLFFKINRSLIIIFALLAITSYYVSFPGISIVFVIAELFFAFPIVMAMKLLKSGYQPARFFVLGSMFFLTGIIGSLTIMMHWLPAGPFTVFYPDNIGSILLFVMLSVSLGDKVNILKKEQIEAQEKALLVLEEKVQERTVEVVKQKHLVEEKQKEILDSIAYAKRLQEAILPSKDFIAENLRDNFILYQPKDIVAGDFYWAEKKDGLFYIAAADSTGHGVPGAMVSVVCSTALNRAVKEFELITTGQILDKARELVIETFEKSQNEVKDGMDISLLCLELQNRTVTWSGANNPLWFVQNGELKEIKADKQPIGKTENPKPFTTHSIDCKQGAIFYLFTDGLPDQFGGPNGKKFKHKQFEDLLVGISRLPMNEQERIIGQKFNGWKGTLEQVDDVCIIGLTVN